MTKPFRWDVARREQLGRLTRGEPAESYPEFIPDLRRCCARVLAAAGDARLVFVGRSPESLFDYLTGALAESSWAARPALLNVSLRGPDGDGNDFDAHERQALQQQLAALGLDPGSIAASRWPVAVIDLINTGATLGSLIQLLLEWATDEKIDSQAVRRRLRVVGITIRQENSPKTWRWQQRAGWAAAFPRRALIGVSVPWELWDYLGNWQKKVARPNPSWRWADPEMHQPPRDAEHAEALRLALSVHELARTRPERIAFTNLLATDQAMRHAWLRTLVTKLRAGGARRG